MSILQDGRALLQEALESLNRGELARAEQRFELLHHLYPRSAAPLIGLAQVALRQKQYAKAESYLLQSAGYEPHLPEVWQSLVMLYNTRGDTPRLRWALEMWHTVEPSNPQAVAILRTLYEQVGDQQALQRLQTTWKRHQPNLPLPKLSPKRTHASVNPNDLSRLIQQNPNRADLREAYVALLFQKKQYRQAIPHLEQLRRLQPKVARHPYNLALCWIASEQYAKAHACLLQARQLGIPRADLARPLALVLLQLNRPAEALPELEWLYRQKPNDAEIARAYGVALVRLEQYLPALKPLQQWTRAEPKSATAWYLLGIASALSGQSQQALESLERAVRLDPQSLLMRYHRAVVLAQAEKLNEARQALEALLQEPKQAQQPLYLEMARTLLNLLRHQKVWDACEQWLSRLERTLPNEPVLTHERALTLLAQERYSDLRSYLETQIPKVDPEARRALWGLLAESYLREGKSDLAVQTAERALPEPEPLLNLARMFARQGQQERAIGHFRRLLTASLTPLQRQEVELRLAKLLAKTGNAEEALQLLRASLQQNPRDEERAVALALILTDLNRPEAYSAWEAVRALQPRHLEARLRLALHRNSTGTAPDLEPLWSLLPDLLTTLHRQQVELVQQIQKSGGALDLFWLMEAGEPANRLNALLQETLQTLWRSARTPAQRSAMLGRLTDVLARHPESQTVLEFLVERYRETNQPAQAVAVLDRVIRQYPTNAWLYYRKGQLLVQMGKQKEARDAFMQCLRLDPRHSEARKALESLSAN